MTVGADSPSCRLRSSCWFFLLILGFVPVSPYLLLLLLSDHNHYSPGLLQHSPSLALCFMPCHWPSYSNSFSTLSPMIFLKYSFIPQIFTKHLLWARHSTGCWLDNDQLNLWLLPSGRLDFLMDSCIQWSGLWRQNVGRMRVPPQVMV